MRDLTKGNIYKVIFFYAIPLIVGNIFNLFYNLTDMWIVGAIINENALASIGATAPINSLAISFLFGLTNGFAIMTAKYFGAKDNENLKKSISGTIILSITIAFLFTIIGLIFLEDIMSLLNIPIEIFEDAYDYIFIIISGLVIMTIYNICAGILRAIGDTITPLIFLIISALLNIFLDIIFIKLLNIGVVGAAYATLISQGLSAVMCIFYMIKKYKELNLKKENFIISKTFMISLLTSGLSVAFMLSIVGLGTLILQGAINKLGPSIIVSHSAARKITEMFMLPIGVFGVSSATFTSQNLGANNIKRIREGMKKFTIILFCWSFVVIIATYTVSPFLIKVITSTKDQFIIDTAVKYLKFNSLFYFVLSILIILRNAMQGLGDKISPSLSSLIELMGKFVVAFYLTGLISYKAIIISEPATWILCTILLLFRIRKNKILKNT